MAQLDKALQLLRRGKLDEGIAILQDLLGTSPDDADILYNLGMAYSDQGQTDKAIQALERAVELRGDPNEHTALGVAYARGGRWDEAADQFRATLKVSPDDVFALKNLGAVLAQIDQYDEAIETLERAYQLHPEQTDIAYNIGRAYEGKEDTHTADDWYQKALAVPGPDEIRDRVKDARRRIAEGRLREPGFRPDAMMYCLGALQTFKGMSLDEIRAITRDIGFTGQRGFDINNPSKRYTLKSMDGEFSGLQLVSYLYVGVKIVYPDMDPGIDLENEYQRALALFDGSTGDRRGISLDYKRSSRVLRTRPVRRRSGDAGRARNRQTHRVPA